MKIKTADLKGAALDWAVAKCEGEDYSPVITYDGIGNECPATNYSSNWDLAGSIIRRERISIMAPIVRRIGKERHALPIDLWRAMICTDENEPVTHGKGATELIAAMRCFVASKLGDEVEVPEELA